MENNYYKRLRHEWQNTPVKPGTFIISCVLIGLVYIFVIQTAADYSQDAFSKAPMELSQDGKCLVDYTVADITDKNGVSSSKCVYKKRVFLEDLQKLGPVGDSFAIATSLISAFTLAIVVLGYKLQYNVSTAQKQQLIEERKASKLAQEELEQQNRAIREAMLQQTNDRQAFDWIELHHRMVEKVDISLGRQGVYGKGHGKKGFQLLADVVLFEAGWWIHGRRDPTVNENHLIPQLPQNIAAEVGALALDSPNKFISEVEKFFEKHRHEHDSDLGHLFRNAYRLLKWIDEEGSISGRKKWEYASILRAQLSFGEITLFLLNAATEQSGKAAPLFSKYAMFENLPENSVYLVAYRQDQRFPASAFDADIAKEAIFDY
jgi:hypothetical protein